MFLKKVRTCRQICTKSKASIKPFELIPTIQNYDWGKQGETSFVAQLAKQNNGLKIECNTPYAELWMGVHPNGTSLVKDTKESLTEKLDSPLTFLFKVLSIRKALSLQVHPDKEEAAWLHKYEPTIYKDANHKPEIAIAVTKFEAMAGFREPYEIYNICNDVKPLKQLFGERMLEKLANDEPEILKIFFQRLVTLNAQCIKLLIEEIKQTSCSAMEKHGIWNLFKRLSSDYPTDYGVLCCICMNHIKLRPGEAIFIKPHQPHFYVSGDCVECMATSDNVVRAALTEKFKDLKRFFKMVQFVPEDPEDLKFESFSMGKYFRVFAPPVSDFSVVGIMVPENVDTFAIPSCLSGSILLMLDGNCSIETTPNSGLHLSRGSVLYLPESCNDFNVSKSKSQFVYAYLALPNRFIDEPQCL